MLHTGHECVCVVYRAESYAIFILECVGFVKLSVADSVSSKQSTQRATRDFFILQQPKHPGRVSNVIDATARWLLDLHVGVVCATLVIMLQDLQIEVP